MTNPDTPQQKYILRTSRAARWVRRNYPNGTELEGANGLRGTVKRHVPTSSAGGYLVVEWANGITGRLTVLNTGIKKVTP